MLRDLPVTVSVFANSGGQFSCVSTLEKVNFQLTIGGPVEIAPVEIEATAPRFPRMHAYVDIAVVIVVLVGTNLIAHFTTAWASIATVPISALVLLALTKRRGMGWAELGLSPRDLRRGSKYALAAVGLVLTVVAVGALLPLTRPFFMADRYATISGAIIASMIVIPLQTVIPEELAFRGVLHGTLNRVSGFRGVAAAGSLMFGLWHIASSMGLTSGNEGFPGFSVPESSARSPASSELFSPPLRPVSSSPGFVIAAAASLRRLLCIGR